MAASNKNLVITVVVLIALAIAGAAAYTGFVKKDTSADQPAPIESTDVADVDVTPTEEPAAENTTEDTAATTADDTATASGSAFDLQAALAPRGIGNPNAPIKIVEYASLTCNHCAHFHNDVLPELKSKYIDTGKVYLEFQEFPLNAPALDASLLARCLPAERYDSFTGLLFKTQEDWTTRPDYITALKQNAKLAGLSEQGIDDCLKSNDLRMAIGQNIQKASETHKIASTPTFVINDGAEIIRGAMPVAEFEKVFTKLSGATPVETPADAPAATPDVETPAADDTAPDAEQPAE